MSSEIQMSGMSLTVRWCYDLSHSTQTVCQRGKKVYKILYFHLMWLFYGCNKHPQKQRPLCLSHRESERFGRQSAARRGRMITRQPLQKVAICVSALGYGSQIRCHCFITGLSFTISKRGRVQTQNYSTSPCLLHYSMCLHLRRPVGVVEWQEIHFALLYHVILQPYVTSYLTARTQDL